MRIGEIYREGRFGLSIEVFPPKTPQGDDALSRTLERLAVYRPDFISCTYGAGGSTQDRTLEWCRTVQDEFAVTATGHLTCVGSTCDELLQWLGKAEEYGIGNVMALRGDPPENQDTFETTRGGFGHANELVGLIREKFPAMGIGVAGYPETHVEAPDPQTDLDNLKRKVESGADAVYTQLFYDNISFFEFRERYLRAGISAPLVPGIMPISEFARMKRITSMCGSRFPDQLAARLEAVQDDKQAQFEIGVEHAIGQCQELKAEEVPGIHFYVLNRSQACERILNELGMHPPKADCA